MQQNSLPEEVSCRTLTERMEQKVLIKKMTEYLLRAEIYLINLKSTNDLEINHQISVIYEKISGKDFLIHIALQGA
jgi:hypothetical protein